MKANPNIDELLSSFLDGELPPRQQTEVQRLVARDPEVGRRLRQLQSSKTLVSALPRAQAPVEMLERIKLALERQSLLDEPSTVSGSRAGARRLMARRVLAAAAMFAVLGVLGAVVYQIVAPVPGAGTQRPMALVAGDQSSTAPVVAVADSGLSGRLEIRAAGISQAEALVARVIKERGLSASIEADVAAGTTIYRLAGTRDGVNGLFADLGRGWQHLGSTTLHVEGREAGAPAVTIEGVTAEQAMRVVAQKSTQTSLQTAQDYAILNGMAANTPGREVLALVSDDAAPARDMLAFDDIARLAGPGKDATAAPSQDATNVTLTIILLRTR